MSSSTTSRTDEMLSMRRNGASLGDIGNAYGISRERVRQIIGREGSSEGAAKREARRQAEIEQAMTKAQEFVQDNPSANYREVARAAGVSYSLLRRHGFNKPSATYNVVWSNDEIISAAHRFKSETGRFPNSQDWQISHNGDYPSYATVFRRFGSWSAFRAECGEV